MERDGRPGEEPGGGAVDPRKDEGGTPDGEPSRDGARLALPGARKAVHSRERRSDQGLARVRRQARALTRMSDRRRPPDDGRSSVGPRHRSFDARARLPRSPQRTAPEDAILVDLVSAYSPA